MASSKSKSKSRTKQLSSTRPTFPASSSSHSPSASPSTSTSKPTSSSATRKSSRTTQSIITTHHILNKRLHSAIAIHGEESPEVSEIKAEIERRGGLRVYQDASFTGQMGERGGDSSGVLVGWLREDESLGLGSRVGMGVTGHRTGKGKRRGKGEEKGREGWNVDVEDALSEATAQGMRTRKRKRFDEDHDSGDESTTSSDGVFDTPASTKPHSPSPTEHRDHQPPRTLRILEIGALSPHNHLSTLQLPNTKVQIRRIDLRSTHPQIEQRDFMTLDPQEVWQGDVGYDVLSLSLVLNFVGDARGRGEMLGWTRGFFRRRGEEGVAGGGGGGGRGGGAMVQNTDDNDDDDDNNSSPKHNQDKVENTENTNTLLPALFLVLPLPTLTNSRYLTEPHLTKIMACLGYTLTTVKRSAKVYYSLWRFEGEHHSQMRQGRDGGDGGGGGMTEGKGVGKRFGKKELRGGRERNNFCIVLDA